MDYEAWPEWCYLPLSAWYAVVTAHLECDSLYLGTVGDVSRLGALGAWRMTKGVYQFEPSLYDTLTSVERLSGSLPAETFLRLPEWCVYIQTPRLRGFEYIDELYGAFVHLEWDANTHETDLRFYLDGSGPRLPGIPLHLGNWSIASGLRRTYDQAIEQLQRWGEWTEDRTETLRGVLDRLCALTLYLCSDGVQIKGPGKPGNPSPKKTKGGWKLFPADGVRRWRAG